MDDSELRQNKATGEWVIIAPGRGKRPGRSDRHERRKEALPLLDGGCPFCPGNEDMLPEVVLKIPDEHPDTPWQTRVIPNKYPALSPCVGTRRRVEGIYTIMPGYGRHEVIIETPEHNRDISQMSQEAFSLVIETYHRRHMELMAENRNLMTIIFRNHGGGAGTSLIHPHSQIVVTGIVPTHIRLREETAQRFFDHWGRCVYCEILEYELVQQERVVLENDDFVAFVPFAASSPFETWILPREHEADFGSIKTHQKESLTSILLEVLAKLRSRLNDPDYNYIINTSAQYRAREPQLHWFVQIKPRLTNPAGFEIGSGISINPSLPEQDACILKGC